MTYILYIALFIAYATVGAAVGSRYQTIAQRTCEWAEGKPDRYGTICNCYDTSWCGHTYAAFWFYGALWWLALPMTVGLLVGTRDKDKRLKIKRAREIDAANHKLELAKIARREDEELDKQLEAQARQRAKRV